MLKNSFNNSISFKRMDPYDYVETTGKKPDYSFYARDKSGNIALDCFDDNLKEYYASKGIGGKQTAFKETLSPKKGGNMILKSFNQGQDNYIPYTQIVDEKMRILKDALYPKKPVKPSILQKIKNLFKQII